MQVELAFLRLLCSLVFLDAAIGLGQAPAAAPASSQPARPIGVVTAIDSTAKRIGLKTDSGVELLVVLEDQASLLRVAPGEKDLKNAAKVTFSDLAVGDRILVRGRLLADQKSVVASSVIVMTKGDIARKQEADRAEWQRRGVGGIVTALNSDAKEVTISALNRDGPKPLTIALNRAALRRYAPDSVKFSDAKPSTFAELRVGDQVRALGNRSEDGARFTAEQLVSGSFRNIAGTVISVDSAEKTVKVTDLATKKPLLVRVNADSNLRRLPPFVAQMLAMRRGGMTPGGEAGAGGARRGPEGGAGFAGTRGGGPSQEPAQRGPEGAGGPPSGGAGGPGEHVRGRDGSPDMQQMLEAMPAVALGDLKPGDAIMVASTVGADPAQVTAITLLAGVEPLLTAAPGGGQQTMLGSWNLDLNMNMGMP